MFGALSWSWRSRLLALFTSQFRISRIHKRTIRCYLHTKRIDLFETLLRSSHNCRRWRAVRCQTRTTDIMSQRDQKEFHGSNRLYCICCILPRVPISRFSNTFMIYISDILHNHCIRRCFHMQQPLYRGTGMQEIRRSSSCLSQFSMFDLGCNRRFIDPRCCSPLYSSPRSSSCRIRETALSRPSRILHIHAGGGSIWSNYKMAVRTRGKESIYQWLRKIRLTGVAGSIQQASRRGQSICAEVRNKLLQWPNMAINISLKCSSLEVPSYLPRQTIDK